MDEMTRVRHFRSEVPRPETTDLQAEEGRLLGAMAAPTSVRPGRAHVRTHRGRRWRFGLGAGLAITAVAAGVVLVDVDKPHSAPVVRTMPVAAVEALNQAAARVGTQPELHPRPGQYLVYTSQTMSTVESNDRAHHQSRYLARDRQTVWYPVAGDATDGVEETTVLPPKAYPGWSIPPDARETVGHHRPDRLADEDGTPDYLRTDYAHTKRLPTTPKGMYEHLYMNEGTGPLADVHAWANVGELLRAYLPAAQRAALFRAASSIHGVTTVGEATDAAGRTGIGVALTIPGLGTREEYILDRTTYQYLGERGVVTDAARAKAPVGSVLTSSALLKVSVADHAPAIPRR